METDISKIKKQRTGTNSKRTLGNIIVLRQTYEKQTADNCRCVNI